MQGFQWVAICLDILLVALAIWLSLNTQIIKDVSCMPNGEKPYSFARTQLLWWTVIVIGCFIYHAIVCKEIPQLNATALLLLGISAATTASGAVIDNTDMKKLPQKQPDGNLPDGEKAKKLERHQDTVSQGFWTDLLSDAQGTSIHRFQCLLFNIIIGILYVISFGEKLDFPVFNEFVIGLLGISGAGYIVLKAGENKPEVLKTVKDDDDKKKAVKTN